MASVCDGARRALQTAGVSVDDLAAICAGNAGTGQPEDAERMKSLLSQEFPGAIVRICTDLELTLEAAGNGPVVVLLAGTGSAAVGRDRLARLCVLAVTVRSLAMKAAPTMSAAAL